MEILPPLNQLSHWLEVKALDGSFGSNRVANATPHINAKNDYEAIYCWLNEYRHKDTTYRTYQKEAERFLLWSIRERNKPLSSLNRDDFESYIEFLQDPQPRDIWCTQKHGRGRMRGGENWRPFSGPLSRAAIMTALSAIDSLMTYLVNAQYLQFNPLSLIKKRKIAQGNREPQVLNIQARILELNEWETMLRTLETYPEDTKSAADEKARLRFIVSILFFLGLRINELVTHRWNSFRKVEGKWWFFVIGKGNKPAKIPVNDELLRAVIKYRRYLGSAPMPSIDDNRALICSFRTKQALTARQINKIIKRLAIDTAAQFNTQPDVAEKLKKFSAHWLRHLSASMQDRFGIAFKHIRSNLRHENDETTRLYVHALDDERHADMQKLKLNYKQSEESKSDLEFELFSFDYPEV